jgi:hypothetical protein
MKNKIIKLKDLGTFLFLYIRNIMSTSETKKFQTVPVNFCCKICDYNTSRNSQYERHLLTTKHINSTKFNSMVQISSIENKCNNCGKNYKDRSGLWKHKKKCKTVEEEDNIKIQTESINTANISGASGTDASNNIIELLINENKDFKNMIIELVKSNTELQKQMIDVCQKIQPGNTNIHTNSHNNSHNKTFNLQVFLNEECKDALNMSEFINSIEIKVSDLENMGKLGYVEGMSNIIIKQLNDTDINKRPVHCSDSKRETLYVKEENKWEKDTQDTKQMLTAVRGVNKKNYSLLSKWKETHPKCMDSKSNQSDQYMKITSKVMDGDIENINKVIKKIAKQVVIDK